MRIVTLALLAALPIAPAAAAGPAGDAPAPRLWLVPASPPAPDPPARVLGFVHPDSWLVEAPAGALRGRVAVPFEDARKLAPNLARWAKRARRGDAALEVVLHPDAGLDHAAATLAKLAPDWVVFGRVPGPPRRLLVRVPAGRLGDALARLQARPEVLWLDRFQPLVWLNTDSVEPIQANAASAGALPMITPIWDQGLVGTGQIVAIADSGLDRNETWFSRYHNGTDLNTQITDAASPVPPGIGPLFPDRKVVAYWVMPGASAYDDNESCAGSIFSTAFHGTHVTGTAAGDGGGVSQPGFADYDVGDGMAPHAQILFQDLGHDASGCLSGAGGAPMWAQALAGGAFVHSNSYGAPATGGYTAGDAELDDFLWQNPDMLIVFAAGNDGSAGVHHPGNAKHALTVGALNHGSSTLPWSESSRGPASDGRLKPDLAAPGVAIVSARGNDNDTSITAPQTQVLMGTSMATPAVAGAAVMVRQYFADGFYPTGSPTPADGLAPPGPLLKALLLNGTRAYPDTPAPDTGWGRVWLDSNLYFDGDARGLRVWALAPDAGLAEGEFHQYTVQVPTGEEFRATLVWYDPAPALASPAALVNDLDLTVTTPTATVLLGNAFAAGESVAGGAADRLNPVEQVRLAAPAAGSYTLRVDAAAVPGNGQPESDRQAYALVVSAAHCAANVLLAPDFSLTTDGAGVRVEVTGVPGADRYRVYRAGGDCAGAGSRFLDAGTTATTTFDDLSTQGGFRYAYRVRGADACGEGPASACQDVVSQAPCTLVPDFVTAAPASVPNADFCAVDLTWPGAAARCPGAAAVGYEVHRSDDPFFDPSAGTRIAAGLGAPRYTDYQAPPGVSSYYRIVAADDLGNAAPATAPIGYAGVGTGTMAGPYQDGAEALALALLEPPWRLSAQAANNGTRGYRNAADGLTYPPNTCAALTTRPMPLGAGAALSYAARWELESGWDGVVVEISADGGSSWTDLPPAGGYPDGFAMTGDPPANACGYGAGQGAFSGSSGSAFVPSGSDLSAWAGQTVMIRWRFSSDPGLELAGFELDDIAVVNAGAPVACIADELWFASGFER